MLRILPFLLCSLVVCNAQFEQLVTTRDGSHVRFVSDLSLRQYPEKRWRKIFEADRSGVRLILVDDPAPGPQPFAWYNNKLYERISPDSSGDGSVQAYTAYRSCGGGSGCIAVERYWGYLATPDRQNEQSFPGLVRLSSNGKWALNYGSTGEFVQGRPPAIINLESNQAMNISTRPWSAPGPGRRMIANDGTVVSSEFQGPLALARADGSVRRLPALAAGPAIIDDNARFVIYETLAQPSTLRQFVLAANADRELVSAEQPCFAPGLTEDGQTLLFLSAANWEGRNNDSLVQAWLMDLATGALRQLSQDPAGLTEATISGDGSTVWAVTLAGRLVKIAVRTGLTEEVVARTAVGAGSGIAGSQSSYGGRGFTDRAYFSAPPYPDTLAGVSVEADGRPVPILAVTPNRILFVPPWDTQGASLRLRLVESPTPFQARIESFSPVLERSPRFFQDRVGGRELIRAAHGDWRGLVAPDDPARPGEIIYAYAIGVGPVIGLPPVDQPAPLDPPASVAVSIRCTMPEPVTFARKPVEVLYAGLAPGMTGIYQISIRLPDPAPNWGGEPQTVSCRSATDSYDTLVGSLPLRN